MNTVVTPSALGGEYRRATATAYTSIPTHSVMTPSSPGADSRRATGASSVTRRSGGYKMVAMLQSGLDLSPIITHRFGIDDFQKGFDAMRSGQSGKVVLDWGLGPKSN